MPTNHVLDALGLDAQDETWADWEQSDRDWRSQATRFLTPSQIGRECQWLGMEPELQEIFVRAGVAIGNDELLARLFGHGHWVFSQAQGFTSQPRNWPMPPSRYGEPGRMVYALVCLSCFDQLRKRNARCGISEAVAKHTLSDLALWVRHHRQECGEWGFSHLGWMTGHLTGALHHLGRLQFQMARFPHDFHLFRSTDAGQVAFLAGEGMRFRRDGQFDGAEGIHDTAGAWTAHFHAAGNVITGYPITTEGAAKQERVSLDARQWYQSLSKDDPILEIHIPACGAMDPSSCDESFHLAREFFPRYFPQHPFKAFTCESWLMDSQLAQHLPATSNIVCFLRRFHRHPLARANDHQTLERVFGSRTVDWKRVPQETTLQRGIVAHVQAGGRWRDAGGVIAR